MFSAGRDACGISLVGSLTVVRRRPRSQSGARPEPNIAGAAYLGLISDTPIDGGGTCTPVLDCPYGRSPQVSRSRGLPLSSPLGCGSLFVVRF
jgi:hypothetical protein